MTEQLIDLPDIQKLTPNIIRILGQNPGKFTLQGYPLRLHLIPGTNTYLLGTGKRRLLIDTGEGIPSWKSLLSSLLESENCTISTVILTHWHHDHVGGISQVKSICPEATFCKYFTSNDEEFLPILDGDEFSVEGASVKAVYTPGHTTDHLCLFMSDSRILFSGDSILGQGTAVFENLSTYISSLRKTLNLDSRIIFPAHGPVIESAKDKIMEYISHRQQREDEIIQVFTNVGGELSPEDIVKVIYAKYPPSLWPAATRGVILHLQKLKEEGKSREVGNGKWSLTNSSL